MSAVLAILALAIHAVAGAASGGPDAVREGAPIADTVYVGTIITMDPAAPLAEAVAVSGDSILAVGARSEVLARGGPGTRIVELDGKAMLPGFVDSHGHLTALAQRLSQPSLASPPVGEVRTIADLQEALRRHIRDQAVPPGGWVIGYGYDDSLLAEGRAPNRDDLDAVSREHLVAVTHVSGHLGAVNSLLLTTEGIDVDSVDPPGGGIRRRAGSREPDGVLEGTAYFSIVAKAPRPSVEQSLSGIRGALAVYASMGVTTVHDGGASPESLALLREAARREILDLDVVGYRFIGAGSVSSPHDDISTTYRNRFRQDGIKMILDGSPQGKTAFLTEPYVVPPPGRPPGYRGYPSMPPPSIAKGIRDAIAQGIPLLAHANGDAAAQMLIDEVEAARRETGERDSRVVMIHAQTVRDDQLDRMKDLGIVPSFFIGHTFYWGDWHREQTLGVRRAERISPARSALERGIAFTLHNDAPIVPPDMIRTLWSTTTRRTRSNDILGPGQRLTAAEALAGMTLNGARQYGEEDRKGSIAAGKLADLVILSANPLEVDPERLLEIRVDETISHGRSVYTRDEAAANRP